MQNALKVVRELKKLTQRELADLVGSTAQTIYRIENHKQKVNRDLALKISKVLETELEDMFTRGSISDRRQQSLRVYRAKKGLSRQQLADFCGVDKSIISDIENHKDYPKNKLANTLSHVLDVPIEKIFPLYKEE